MGKILDAFADGKLITETGSVNYKPVYNKALDKSADLEKQLQKLLNGEEKAVFHNYLDAETEVDIMSATGQFIDGYCLGVLMTMEVFANGKCLIDSES